MRALSFAWRGLLAAAVGAAVLLTPPPAPATAERPFVYGVTIADTSAAPGHGFDMARKAGFTHAYVVLDWQSVMPSRGSFAWDAGRANDLDNFLNAARAHGMRLIVRLGKPAAWAGTPAALNPADMETFAAGVAARARGIATAYEVLNEPNLAYEWGGRPDPARYTQLIAAARRGIKRSDADALVVSAGLAPHTGNAPGTIEDVDFLRGMYAAGARGAFDVLGIHPYGGNTPPESDPSGCGICFRRAEQYRRVMEENGDAATSAWVTEFGYLHTTTLDLGQYNWLKLGPEQQAAHLAGAFRYGYDNWPWLTGMVAFNMDFATVPWNSPTLGAYWFGMLNPDRSPRPVYGALRDLPKRGASSLLPVSAPVAIAPAQPSAISTGSAPTTTSPVQNVVGAVGDVVCQTVGGRAICGLVGALTGVRR